MYQKVGDVSSYCLKKLGTDCPSLRERYVIGSWTLRLMGRFVHGTLCPWDVSSWDASSRDASFGDASSGYRKNASWVSIGIIVGKFFSPPGPHNK
jgi:hypothetical protein